MSSVSVDCLNEAVQREAAPMRGWVIGGWEEWGAEVFIWRTVRVSGWQGRLPPSPLKRLCIHAGICSKCQESWFVFLFVFSYQSILRFWIDAHSHILNDNSWLRQDLKKPFEISALFIKTQYGIGLLFCWTGLLRRRVKLLSVSRYRNLAFVYKAKVAGVVWSWRLELLSDWSLSVLCPVDWSRRSEIVGLLASKIILTVKRNTFVFMLILYFIQMLCFVLLAYFQ